MATMQDDLPTPGGLALVASGYRPGACNIGPAEIARRRLGAIAGTIVTVLVYAGLVALTSGAAPTLPRGLRFAVALPAAGTIVAWLQVWLRFCVNFGSRGVANFGAIGSVTKVADPEAVRADRARVARMLAAAVAGGIVLGIVAVLIP